MKTIIRAVVLAALVLLVLPVPASAGHRSEFSGFWHAIDAGDGSLMRIHIAGHPNGRFGVLWTETHFSACGGPMGIGFGRGQVDPDEPSILRVNMRLRCFLTREVFEWEQVFRYVEEFDVLQGSDESGFASTWSRINQELIPNPFMVGSVAANSIWVVDFMEGATLDLTVYETTEANTVKWEATLEDYDGGIANFHPGDDGIELEEGNLLIVTDGRAEDVLELELITMDLIELGSDFMAGTAPPDRDVLVIAGSGPDPSEQYEIETSSNADGFWSADFAGIADIEDDWLGWSFAQIFDIDGDANEAPTPSPIHLIVFPEAELLEAFHWPVRSEGETVHVEINDPTTDDTPEFETDAVIEQVPWDSPELWIQAEFSEFYDLKAGDIVTLTFGELTVEHSVRELTVDEVNQEPNAVAGTAEAGQNVGLFIHELEPSDIQAITDEDGNWEANFFSIGIELEPGMCGRAVIFDAALHATAIDWCIPNPHFTVFPEWEFIEGFGWPEDSQDETVNVTVDDPETAESPDIDIDVVIEPTPWNPDELWVRLELAPYDLKAGDVVTLSHRDSSDVHTVRELSVDEVNAEADTVSGMGEDGAQMLLWVHEFDDTEIQTTADGEGNWEADFSTISFDLEPGMCGRAEIRDADGNATAVDWCVPELFLTAFPENDNVFGYGWPEGSDVTMIIEPGGFSQTVTVGPAPWDENDILAFFEFAGEYDLVAGDTVSLSGSGMERTHTVIALTVDEVDPEADSLAGTAPTGSLVLVSVFGVEAPEIEVLVEDGSWSVNLLADYGIDISEGMCGRAEIHDEDRNATAVDWCVPDPLFTVFPHFEWFDGYGWPDGEVSIGVAGKPECDTSQTSSDGFFNGGFPEGCDVVTGDLVTFSDGTTTRNHTVRNLYATTVDEAANSVSGTADGEVEIRLWVHEFFEDTELFVTSDVDGNWTADFSPFDLQAGMCGRAEIRDEVGNSTADDWCAEGA